jgi:CTP synthase
LVLAPSAIFTESAFKEELSTFLLLSFCRSDADLGSAGTDAQSGELDESAADPVIVYMPEISRTQLGGTMRLGLRATVFTQNSDWSTVKKLYGNQDVIWERHRHRYEVNPEWVQRIEKAGLVFTGRDEKGERMQVAEIKGSSCVILLRHLMARQTIPSTSACKRIRSSAPGPSTRRPATLASSLPRPQANYQMPHSQRHLRMVSNPGTPIPGTPILKSSNDFLDPNSASKVNGTH